MPQFEDHFLRIPLCIPRAKKAVSYFSAGCDGYRCINLAGFVRNLDIEARSTPTLA